MERQIVSTEEIINATSQLVSIPSTFDNQYSLSQAVTFVADFIKARAPGVTIEWFEQNGNKSFLAYNGTSRPEKFAILLNAHVDVVPGTPDQFSPLKKDGRLYGRGVLDMKGTAMVLASVFSELAEEVPYALGLQIVSDEENGGTNGSLYQLSSGVRADFVVVGEYANHKATIYNAARGICWVEVAFKGTAAHAGHPWKGDNAIVRASRFIDKLLHIYPVPSAESWTTTATISSLSTPNDTYNRIPDYAVVKVDFRFTNEDKVFQSEQSLRAFVADLDPEAEVIDIRVFGAAVHAEQTNPYVKRLHQAMKETTGHEPQYHFRPASSDGRHFAAVGVPCVEFGLYGQNSHAAEEYVEIASFDEYARTMRAFLKQPTH